MKNICQNQPTLLVVLLCLFLGPIVKASSNDIVVKARGSKAKGVYSHFKVLVNGLECGDKHTSMICEEYHFSTPFDAREIDEVKIVFDNDLYSVGEDRNLCIHSIVIGDEIPIKANQETAKYASMNGEEHPYCGMMQWNGTLTFDINKLRFHPGNITLTSQDDVNAFSSHYLEGNLTISGNDITDLTPLSSLASIKGALIIRDNPNLVNINGLNAIIAIDFISIENNPKLISIDGFNSLTSCGGMTIRNNYALKTIKCFNSPDF